MLNATSRQITIVHLSDIHFGDSHQFGPPEPSSNGIGTTAHYPSLLETLQADWNNRSVGNNIIIAVTGDLTFKAAPDEFQRSQQLLEGIVANKVLGQPVSKNEVFVIPGNHDVIYSESDKELRWQPFSNFYRNFYDGLPERAIDPKRPETLTRVHNRSHDLGLIVIEINSCVYVEKGSSEEHRGHIDLEAIAALREELRTIPADDLRRSIRIALVHHHPVLIPAFAEPELGYDSILNSASLLKVLRDYGIHLVLHGHKHYPHTFSYDVSCSWLTDEMSPMLIVSGGSAGSRQLPSEENAVNTYNLITLKWNWNSREARVSVQTRGLSLCDANGKNLLPTHRKWSTLRQMDKLLKYKRQAQRTPLTHKPFADDPNGAEAQRLSIYDRLRDNMPVVEVIPSLNPTQEYEAKVWIAAQPGRTEIPQEVTWSAGRMFRMAQCASSDNPNFLAYFSFWGPMIIQARIRFADGSIEYGYVYAHMPNEQSPSE